MGGEAARGARGRGESGLLAPFTLSLFMIECKDSKKRQVAN